MIPVETVQDISPGADRAAEVVAFYATRRGLSPLAPDVLPLLRHDLDELDRALSLH
jgi:hypothetical protein